MDIHKIKNSLLIVPLFIQMCAFSPSYVFSQSNLAGTQNNPQTDVLFSNYNTDFRNIFMDSQKSNDVKAPSSVHLHKDWDNSLAIETLDGKSLKLSDANYNITEDKFEVKASKDSVFVLESSAIKQLVFAGDEFVRSKTDGKYYQKIWEGNRISFFKRYAYRLKKAAVNPMTMQKLGEDKVVIFENFFIRSDDNDEMVPITLNKKGISKLAGKQKSEVIEYANENKLSYKEEEDMLRILQYFDTI